MLFRSYEIYYKEYSHYTHTMRFPAFVVPVQDTARFIRLAPRRVIETVSPPGSYYGTYRDGEISFMEIEVYRTDLEPRREAQLVLNATEAPDRPCLYYQAGEMLLNIFEYSRNIVQSLESMYIIQFQGDHILL